MDNIKTGALIRQLRTSAGLTQKQLAEKLCVSDKAVSKWECGSGLPDIALLSDLLRFTLVLTVLLLNQCRLSQKLRISSLNVKISQKSVIV